MKTRNYITVFAVALVVVVAGCKKISEERPENSFTREDAIQTPQDVQNLLNSCYDAFANQWNGYVQSTSDLLSDDLEKPLRASTHQTEIYQRNTIIFNTDLGEVYRNLYLIPFRVNSLPDLYDKVGVSQAERMRMDAEARFLRAICHFEVVRLWAQPAGYTPDNSHIGIVIRDEISQLPKQRSSVKDAYDFIINDLKIAEANLPPSNGNYANKWAAKALLAKVYFQLNDRETALLYLNDVIANSGKTLAATLNRFDNVAAQSEYIFATVSTNSSNDNRGRRFIDYYRSDKNNESFVISRDLYNLLTTDTTDLRGKTLVTVKNLGMDNEHYAVNKFNKDYFGVPVLTLTEMLLTRAELLAEKGNVSAAADDINQIVARAYSDSTGKSLSPLATPSGALTFIRLQRRLELFCEGDRVQELKRIGAYQIPNLTIRNAPWNCPGMVLQFPSTETGNGFIFNESGGCN